MRIGYSTARHRRDSLLGSLFVAALVFSGPAGAAPAKPKKAPAATATVAPAPHPAPRAAAATGVLPIMGMVAQRITLDLETAETYQWITQQTRDMDRALSDCRSGQKAWTPALKSFAALIDEVGEQNSAELAALLVATWNNIYMRDDTDATRANGLLAALASGHANQPTRSALSYYVLAKRGFSVGLVDFQIYENGIRKPNAVRTLTVVHERDKTLILDLHSLPNKPVRLSYELFRQWLAAASFVSNDVGMTGLSVAPYFNPDVALWPTQATTEQGVFAFPPAPYGSLDRAAKAALPAQSARDALSIRPLDNDTLSLMVARIGLSAAQARGLTVEDVPSFPALRPRETAVPENRGASSLMFRGINGTVFEAKSETERNFVVLPRLNGAFGIFAPRP